MRRETKPEKGMRVDQSHVVHVVVGLGIGSTRQTYVHWERRFSQLVCHLQAQFPRNRENSGQRQEASRMTGLQLGVVTGVVKAKTCEKLEFFNHK